MALELDVPGLDPIWLPSYQFQQPNQWAGLKHNAGAYPATPARQEFYTSFHSDEVGSAVMTYSNNNSCCVVNGSLVSPSLQLMNLPRWWRRGYTGKGVKIGILGFSYNTSHEHKSIAGKVTVYPGDDGGVIGGHELAVMSAAAGRLQENGAVGAAPDAELYFAIFTGQDTDTLIFDWFEANGVKIVSTSVNSGYQGVLKARCEAFIRNGGIFVFAGGNDHGATPQPVTAFANVRGSVSVSGLIGGGVLDIKDELFYNNVLPQYPDSGDPYIESHIIDFALPFNSITARFDGQAPGGTTGGPTPPDGDNFYGTITGTSFTAPAVAGAMAVLQQRFPTLPARVLYWMLRRGGYQFTDPNYGINVTVPRLP